MIKLENVTKVYGGDHVALRDANVDIDKGEFVFLIGASGSGKSTFLRLLNKQEAPTEGRIFVAGKNIGELPGYNSFMGHDPETGVTVVVWANLAPLPDGRAPAIEIAKTLIGQIYPPAG